MAASLFIQSRPIKYGLFLFLVIPLILIIKNKTTRWKTFTDLLLISAFASVIMNMAWYFDGIEPKMEFSAMSILERGAVYGGIYFLVLWVAFAASRVIKWN